jgi:hypothetical protein
MSLNGLLHRAITVVVGGLLSTSGEGGARDSLPTASVPSERVTSNSVCDPLSAIRY